jgi:phosphoenolpyruvate-protein phosphotransferase (PTS system enzyme I)
MISPMSKTKAYSGLTAAPGLAVGPALLWREVDLSGASSMACETPEQGWETIRQAIDDVTVEIKAMQKKVLAEAGKDEAAIFAAHLMMVDDSSLHDLVKKNLQEIEYPDIAWQRSINSFVEILAGLPDPTLSARAADVRDIGFQVLVRLLGVSTEGETKLQEPSVILARDLSPSQISKMDRELILAFCTAEGGPTSHTAILSKALAVPAIVAMGDDILTIPDGSNLLIDAQAGVITLNPSTDMVEAFDARRQQAHRHLEQELVAASQPAITRDGVQAEIFANITGAEDLEMALQYGAEGVGLFRTEFLFLGRSSMPDIEEQISAYREVIHILNGRPLVVRTLDIGGDKQVAYLGIQEEPHPFLGWRASRMLSERPEVLEDQFYALLKAAVGTDLRIIVPMVSQVQEVIRARVLLDNALARVRADQKDYEVQLQFGIMVEVPSAALMVEHFAPHVDFYSIGTNDLTQYTLAVDRMNARVADLASPFSPSVLKLIERTVRVAHAHGKWVSMCGEFAAERLAVPFLLGVGLDEFSMSAQAIPAVKQAIRKWDVSECQNIAKQALALHSAQAVREFLEGVAK